MNKMYLSDWEISEAVNAIVLQMYKDMWRPDYIVGITRGGLIPAVQLSHAIDVPMRSLDVSLRDGNDMLESNCWMSEDAFGVFQQGVGYEGKNILILDDINDTGATFDWIRRDWQSTCMQGDSHWNNVWHHNVRFAAMVDNLASGFKIDYSAREINKAENDVWVVFPWER